MSKYKLACGNPLLLTFDRGSYVEQVAGVQVHGEYRVPISFCPFFPSILDLGGSRRTSVPQLVLTRCGERLLGLDRYLSLPRLF